MENYEALWQTVQAIYPGSPLEIQQLREQLQKYRGKLLNLFANKVHGRAFVVTSDQPTCTCTPASHQVLDHVCQPAAVA